MKLKNFWVQKEFRVNFNKVEYHCFRWCRVAAQLKKKCNAEKLLRPQNICNKSAEKIDCSQLKQKKMNNSLFFQSILTRRRIFFLLVVVTEWWPKIILLFHDSSNSLHLLENPANRTKIWSSSFIYLLRGTNKLFTRVLCQTLTHSLKLSPLISPLSLFPCSLSDRERESSVRVCVRVYGRQSVRERERERELGASACVCVSARRFLCAVRFP